MNGLVSYHLLPDSGASDSDADFFEINPEDGTIILTRSLDRENQAKHHLLVMASDQGNPSLSSTAHIWIRGWYSKISRQVLFVTLIGRPHN